MTPRFSVLTAVCDPPAEVLQRCLRSVATQTWGDYEHVLIDDASTSPHVRPALAAACAADPRVRVQLHTERLGIARSSADALAAATGELVALLDHDDELAPEALERMHVAMQHPAADVAYSDHDVIRPDGRLADPFYKPDFSPERLRHQNYITHLLVARRRAVEAVGGFRPGFDGAQDHDLVLRLTERSHSVVHVPEVLYHWRQTSGSVSLDPTAKHYAYERGRSAVQEQCDRLGVRADVEMGEQLGTYRVRRRLAVRPPVSVLIESQLVSSVVWGRRRDALDRLVSSLRRSDYEALEIIVGVDRGVLAPRDAVDRARVDALVRRMHGWGVRVVEAATGEAPLQAAAHAASAGVVVLLDERMMLIDPQGIDELIGHLGEPTVAVVGSAQFNADGTIRHAGYVTSGSVSETLFGWPGSHPGPGRVLAVTREVSAVDPIGAALDAESCRSLLAAGARSLAAAGVASCLEHRRDGRRTIWTPRSRWYRFDGGGYRPTASSPPSRLTHDPQLTDPYYNINLVPGRGDWLELPGRAGAPPYYLDQAGSQRWV